MPQAKVIAPYRMFLPTGLGGWSKDVYDMFSTWSQAGFERIDDLSVPPNDPNQQHSEITLDDWYLNILSNQGVPNFMDAIFLWLDQIVKLNQPDSTGFIGDIFYYQTAYHELEDPDKPCPYSTTDPQENWWEYGTSGQTNHLPIQLGDYWYRSMLSDDPTNFPAGAWIGGGSPIPCSWWYDFVRQPNRNQTGINRMIDLWEFRTIQAANAEPTRINPSRNPL